MKAKKAAQKKKTVSAQSPAPTFLLLIVLVFMAGFIVFLAQYISNPNFMQSSESSANEIATPVVPVEASCEGKALTQNACAIADSECVTNITFKKSQNDQNKACWGNMVFNCKNGDPSGIDIEKYPGCGLLADSLVCSMQDGGKCKTEADAIKLASQICGCTGNCGTGKLAGTDTGFGNKYSCSISCNSGKKKVVSKGGGYSQTQCDNLTKEFCCTGSGQM